MRRALIKTLVMLALSPLPALAVEPVIGAQLGTTPAEISARLADSQYELTRYERQTSRIELTLVKEGRRLEVYLGPATGEVTQVEDASRRGPSPLPGIGDAEIRARLQADGYEIMKYEREHGRVEVYANRDGRRWELKIDPRDGRIVEIEEKR